MAAINLRCTDDEKATFERVAKLENHTTVQQWILWVLRRESQRALEPKKRIDLSGIDPDQRRQLIESLTNILALDDES